MFDVRLSISMTVSGESNPCAVGKEGSVSLLHSTDCDSVVDPCLCCCSLPCREILVGDDFGMNVALPFG